MDPMHRYLKRLTQENPQGLAIAFKTGPVIAGALRACKDDDTLFELLAPSQMQNPQTGAVKEILVLNTFAADVVERVMIMQDQLIERPPLIVPKH